MTSKSSAKHVYIEVGSDLLAKPTALTQLIEGSSVAATLVFCNTPSDADLVEVLLKKRGVAAKKLIGNVDSLLVEKTMESLRAGELSTIVLTDIAAKFINIDEFDMLISYSAPSDLSLYNSRTTREEKLSRLSSIITLVGPMDVANFTSIKAELGDLIQPSNLPSPEDIQKSKVLKLKSLAVQKNVIADPKYKVLTEILLNDKSISKEEREQTVAMLIQNTLEVLPSLQSSVNRDSDYDDEDDSQQPSFHGNRSDRNQGRNGRNNNRRDDRRNNNRRTPGHGELNEEASLQQKEAQARIRRRESLPPLKEARIYIGKGKNSGLDEAGLKSLLASKAEINESDIRRTIIRKDYVFFDVLDEISQPIVDKLSSDELLVKKATVISTQRQAENSSDEDSLETAPTLEEIQSQQPA
jgi:superfamily II DNA/RNA helicase